MASGPLPILGQMPLCLSHVEFHWAYFLLLPVIKTGGCALFQTRGKGQPLAFLLQLPFPKRLNGQRKMQEKGKNTQILRDGQCSETKREVSMRGEHWSLGL